MGCLRRPVHSITPPPLLPPRVSASPKDLSDEHARAVVGIVACTLGVLRLRCSRRALGLTVLRARGARQRAGRELVGRGKNQRRDELVWEE